MKHVSEYLPLETDFASGHTDGIFDCSTEAATRCLGQAVVDVHVEIMTQNGIPLNAVHNASLELQVVNGDYLSFHIAHAGAALLCLDPIYPQTLDDGFASTRVSLSSTYPWSCLLGNRLRGLDLFLTTKTRVKYQISGFLFHFTSEITVGCENDGQDDINLQFNPDWIQSTRTLAKWLNCNTC